MFRKVTKWLALFVLANGGNRRELFVCGFLFLCWLSDSPTFFDSKQPTNVSFSLLLSPDSSRSAFNMANCRQPLLIANTKLDWLYASHSPPSCRDLSSVIPKTFIIRSRLSLSLSLYRNLIKMLSTYFEKSSEKRIVHSLSSPGVCSLGR